MRFNKFDKSMTFGSFFLGIALILLFLNKFYTDKYLAITTFVFYVIAVISYFKAFLFDLDLTAKNIMKNWEFKFRYFSGLGYSLFSGGIISLLLAENGRTIAISIGIIISGLILVIVGEKAKQKIDYFNELVLESKHKK